ncbi:hypothetical protein D3C71_1679100 [compost metagenome]
MGYLIACTADGNDLVANIIHATFNRFPDQPLHHQRSVVVALVLGVEASCFNIVQPIERIFSSDLLSIHHASTGTILRLNLLIALQYGCEIGVIGKVEIAEIADRKVWYCGISTQVLTE